MRPGAGFTPIGGAGAATPAAAASPHSTWHSPVPYLFGGLAAMLGLIAFALLILACSYMKLSGFLDGGADVDSDGGGAAEGKGSAGKAAAAAPFEERIVVIMAGDEKPTFLATPICRRVATAALAEEKEKEKEKEEKAAESGVNLPGGDQTREAGDRDRF